MQQRADFKSSFLALIEEESPGDHPGAEVLAAYREGELSAEQGEGVRRHLSGCRECSELARDLDLFEDSTLAGEGNELEVAAFLRSLQPQLASVPARTSVWRPLAVAASLILAVAATWWLARDVTERRVLAELSRPRANVSVLDLVEDRSERTGSPARTVEMAMDAGAVLVLTPDRPGDFPRYEARILDSGGALVSAVEDLEKDSHAETFTLWIPPGGLAAGEYRLELRGLSGERAEMIAGYRIRVFPEAPP